MIPPPDTSPVASLRLVTLGAAELVAVQGDERSLIFGPGKPLALLAYLAASPGLSARREHLLDLLWADVEPDAGRHALRQLVWYVRQRAGDILDATRDSVRLRVPIPSDREELVAAVDRSDCDAVVALHHGDYLPNIGLPGGGEFEQWADLERRHLRAAYLRCGDAVARRMLAAGQYRDAASLARRLRDTDRDSEPAWRLYMEALLSADDRIAAATEADALVRLLQVDDRQPEPATATLIRRAGAALEKGTGTSPAQHAIVTDLIGRAEEFGMLLSAWNDVREGRHRHIHVIAPAGIGKSRLLGDFAARLRAKGGRVVTINARPGDRLLPQSAAGELAAALARLPGAAGVARAAAECLVALNPALSNTWSVVPDQSQGEEGIRRRTLALAELVAAVTDDASVALLVDDLHWVDDASRRMLTSVFDRAEQQRLLLVTASRPRYPAITFAWTTTITLAPLSDQQIGSMLGAIASLPEAPWAAQFPRALHAATEGSPLLVLETLQLLLEQKLLQRENDQWLAPEPTALKQALGAGSALGARIARLPAEERAILATLSLAGVGISARLLAAAEAETSMRADSLMASLERRGLAMQGADGWHPAHDAIAEAILAAESDEATTTRQSRLANAHLSQARDAYDFLQAARHFSGAKDARGVRTAFQGWLRLVRAQGDARRIGALASEFVPAGAPLTAAGLSRSAPLRHRYSRRTMSAAAATFLVTTLGAATFAITRESAPPPEAVLRASYDDDGEEHHVRIELRGDDFASERPIELETQPAARAPLNIAIGSVPSPNGRHWATDSVYPDSGGQDVVIVDAASGAVRRLTSTPGDDFLPAWSPDGEWIAFSSGGRHPLEHSKLVVQNIRTQRSRQITTGDDTDYGPLWHPTGTSIWFTRRPWTERPDELCSVTFDGAETTCRSLVNDRHTRILGWYDLDRLIMVRSSGSESNSVLAILNVRTLERQPLGDLVIRQATLSPDGRWVLCECRSRGLVNAPVRWHVFPVERPEQARQLLHSVVDDGPVSPRWDATPVVSRMLTGLSISAPDLAPINVRTQLRPIATDVHGRAVPGVPFTWEGQSPSVARVDRRTGALTPIAPGRAIVRVSAGGWRSANVAIDVRTSDVRTLLREDWSGGLHRTFVPFGAPMPEIARVPGLGNAMVTNGDHSYTSGVYSRGGFDGTQGLGLEARVSTPIDMMQWQMLSLSIVSIGDSAGLAAWDHRTGSIPTMTGGRGALACSFGVPHGEGPRALRSLNVSTNQQVVTVPLPAALRSGRPYMVRVQLMPDGSCGVAIDGTPVMVVQGLPSSTVQHQILLDGYSFRTTIAVGALELWSGVKPDIDWRRVAASHAR